MICLEDFCGRWGNFYPVQFWADFDPETRIVSFGGEWADIPDWVTPQPTETELYAYVDRYLPEFTQPPT